MFLDYFALGVLIFVAVTLFYAVIAVHDIPYEIAKSRNHPHQDSIHVAGWVSLFTLHVLWPFLWIWATLYRPDRGWGMVEKEKTSIDPRGAFAQFEERIARLEQRLPDDNFKQSFVPKKPERIVAEEKSAPLQPVENP